jgi:hypothetical protein
MATKISLNGKRQTIKQWSIETGLSVGTIMRRLKAGLTTEECLTKPVRKIKKIGKIKYKRRSRTIAEWAEILNINKMVLTNRLRRGWSVEHALEYPLQNKKK